ncbi:MAG TPA: DUF4258 domain-containing protein [Phnomibacter sp.]|nr:DUF4258 domain-containing protein [Phnomibacter sp.]
MATPSKKANRYAPVVALVLLLVAWLVVKQCNPNGTESKTTTRKKANTTQTTTQQQGLNRHPSQINYSKHARCRMDCRHISVAEVQGILQNGTINYGKSELGNNPDCQRKYAVEGKTNDGQKVRIIFAPCASEVTVVTVIDLGKDWECHCE